jgi:hypothetical protein
MPSLVASRTTDEPGAPSHDMVTIFEFVLLELRGHLL